MIKIRMCHINLDKDVTSSITNQYRIKNILELNTHELQLIKEYRAEDNMIALKV